MNVLDINIKDLEQLDTSIWETIENINSDSNADIINKMNEILNDIIKKNIHEISQTEFAHMLHICDSMYPYNSKKHIFYISFFLNNINNPEYLKHIYNVKTIFYNLPIETLIKVIHITKNMLLNGEIPIDRCKYILRLIFNDYVFISDKTIPLELIEKAIPYLSPIYYKLAFFETDQNNILVNILSEKNKLLVLKSLFSRNMSKVSKYVFEGQRKVEISDEIFGKLLKTKILIGSMFLFYVDTSLKNIVLLKEKCLKIKEDLFKKIEINHKLLPDFSTRNLNLEIENIDVFIKEVLDVIISNGSTSLKSYVYGDKKIELFRSPYFLYYM